MWVNSITIDHLKLKLSQTATSKAVDYAKTSIVFVYEKGFMVFMSSEESFKGVGKIVVKSSSIQDQW